jgi:hypothetical protein
MVARDIKLVYQQGKKQKKLGDRNENGMMSLKEYATGLTGWKWRETEED